MNRNLAKAFLFKWLVSLHFFAGVLVPFFTEWGRISFTSIMVLQSIFQASVLLLEVPTGAVADRLGRKVSMALGALVAATGMLIYSAWPAFWVFALGEVCFAAGYALLSGAEEAFVYDTLKAAGREVDSKRILGRFSALGITGIMIAGPAGSWMADLLGLRYVMMAAAAPAALAALLAFTMDEPPPGDPATRLRYMGTVRRGIRDVLASRPLLSLSLDRIVVGVLIFFVIWLNQPLLLELKVPIIWFGWFVAGFALVQLPVLSAYASLEHLVRGRRRYLVVSAVLAGAGLIALGFASSAPMVAALLVLPAAFGLTRGPLLTNYMNKHIASEARATTLSVISMAERLAFAVVYPLVGLLVETSLRSSFVVIGALVVVFAFLSPVREEHLLD
mgnify:CR=1 FL=1